MATIRCKDITFQGIQAVIFDKDGTLANSESFLRSLVQKRSRLLDAQIPGVQEPLLMAFGLEENRLNPTGLMAVGSRQENEIAAAAYVAETGRGWVEALDMVRSAFTEADQYMQRKADYTPVIDSVPELLQTLTAAHVKLAILSSDSTGNVKDFVQKHQLTPYIHYQTGIDGYLSKTDPELLRQVFTCLEIGPKQTLIVGDSQIDIQLARSAGAAGCIGFIGGWQTPFHVAQADAVASSFDEIQVIRSE